MKYRMLLLGVLIGSIVISTASHAGNCKLTQRITFQSGKVKVDVEEIDADNRDACKAEAERRRVIDKSETDVQKKTVSFGWRGE